MEQKQSVYKGLEFTPVLFVDQSLTSPDYFQITEFPTRLTAGKNLFKLRGHPTNLTSGGALGFEVLDFNGDPIYSEVIDYIDEDKSRVIAIYIYKDTSPGDCTITLVAEASMIQGIPVPAEFRDQVNIRWSRTVAVNPLVPNTTEIIYETNPTVKIQEQIGVQLDRQYDTIQFPIYSTGTMRFFSQNDEPTVELIGGTFISEMENGTITVTSPVNPTPTPSYPISTTPYVSTIKKILTSTTALLDQEYTVYSSQSIFPHTYNTFESSSFSLTYEATPTYTETQNSQSFALIEIEGLEPATGDVSRTKVYTNNKGTIGTWELVNDVELEETQILIPTTSSSLPDVSIGNFISQDTVDTYWEAHKYTGKTEGTTPTIVYSATVYGIIDGAAIVGAAQTGIPANDVVTLQTKDEYKGIFTKNSNYKVTLDAVSIYVDGVVGIYMSGSAFNFDSTDLFNQDLPVQLGKRIGEIRHNGQITEGSTPSGWTNQSERFDNRVFNFQTDNAGHGTIIFVIEKGSFAFSNIQVTTDNDPGYTPDYTRLKTFIETTHKIDNQISFKIEYYNVDGVASKQITYVYDKDWEGGNRYVDGNFSMLTGSLYVADSLESGIAISGLPSAGFIRSLDYQGFESGFPGFLMWSGSALAGQNTKGGVPYTGVGLELYAHTGSYFRYSTADSEIDVRTNKFFFGNISGSFISGSDGLLQLSSSNFSIDSAGAITASAGTIGGTEITSTTLESTTNLPSPDSSPAFKLDADGVISGSDLHIRGVYTPDGGSATQFVLIDTNTGLMQARNIGRQIVSDTTEYSRINVDDDSTFVAQKTYICTLLPYENRILIYACIQASNTSGADAVTGTAKFTLARAITGSNSGNLASDQSFYDSFETATSMGTVAPSTATNTYRYTTLSTSPGESGEIIYTVPAADQARQVEITLLLNLNAASGTTSGTYVRIKNISIIATTDFASSFNSPTVLIANKS